MTRLRFLVLAITSMTPFLRADPPIILGVAGRPRLSVPVALIGGESATLRLLADRAVTPAASSARLFQLAGPVAKPIETPLSLDLDPADPRVLLVRFTSSTKPRPSSFTSCPPARARIGLRSPTPCTRPASAFSSAAARPSCAPGCARRKSTSTTSASTRPNASPATPSSSAR